MLGAKRRTHGLVYAIVVVNQKVDCWLCDNRILLNFQAQKEPEAHSSFVKFDESLQHSQEELWTTSQNFKRTHWIVQQSGKHNQFYVENEHEK